MGTVEIEEGFFFFLTAGANFLNHGENFKVVIGRMKTKNRNP